MSKTVRKKVETAHGSALAGLSDLIEQLSEFHDDLQEKFDDKSEKWQESEKGEAARERLELLESLRDEAQGALDAIENLDFTPIAEAA